MSIVLLYFIQLYIGMNYISARCKLYLYMQKAKL